MSNQPTEEEYLKRVNEIHREANKLPISFSNSFPLVLAGAATIGVSALSYLTNALGWGPAWIAYMIMGCLIFAIGVRRLNYFLQNLKLTEIVNVEVEGESGETRDNEER